MQVQYKDLEDPLEEEMQPIPAFLPGQLHRGALWATAHGITKSPTRLNNWAPMHCINQTLPKKRFPFHTHALRWCGLTFQNYFVQDWANTSRVNKEETGKRHVSVLLLMTVLLFLLSWWMSWLLHFCHYQTWIIKHCWNILAMMVTSRVKFKSLLIDRPKSLEREVGKRERKLNE